MFLLLVKLLCPSPDERLRPRLAEQRWWTRGLNVTHQIRSGGKSCGAVGAPLIQLLTFAKFSCGAASLTSAGGFALWPRRSSDPAEAQLSKQIRAHQKLRVCARSIILLMASVR